MGTTLHLIPGSEGSECARTVTLQNVHYNSKRPFILAIISLVLFFGWIPNGWTQTQTFTSSGQFTVPAGVTSITVECWGGGGAGGGATGNPAGGGGGAGGAYARKVLTVIPGTTYTVTVGGAATGDNGSGNNGNPSWFGTLTTVYAQGGQGGGSASSNNSSASGGTGSSSSSIGDVTFKGGNGGTGSNGNSAGGGGESAGASSDGNNGGVTTGGSGLADGGNGGNGGSTFGNGSSGGDGSAPGGGGGGGRAGNNSNKSGGDGARGQVVVTWVCPTYSLTGTSATDLTCRFNPSTVSLTGTPASLPAGTYTVTYNLSAPNSSTGNTATMTVTTAGSGTFTTSNLNNAGNTTLTITSLASAGCNNSLSSNNTDVITVANNTTPSTPGTISGDGSICIYDLTGNVFSISAVSGATSYTWTVPNGWTITDGQGTTSVTVTAAGAASSGSITVTADNACGASSPRSLSVSVNNDNNIGFGATSTDALSICQGASGNSISGGNPSGSQTFSWEVSTTGASGPFSTAVGSTNSQNYNISSTYYNSAGTYYFRRIVSGGNACDGPSDVVTLTVISDTPTFTACPGNITTGTDNGVCSAIVAYNVTASNGTLTYAFTGATTASGSGTGSGSTFDKGVTNVTVTATGNCGSATCSFTVTVEDDENPVLTCPASITVSNDIGVCGAVVN
ncbi:MAG: hypothetical protein KDD12_21695, partial [Lewinella sp.]|nr:hypothetical protein [Lewinella sp.]